MLFLGNSRLLFALRPEELRPFFAARGVRYYVMGFGLREADRFPLEIIRKFDLRPRLVVVNADGFFGGGLSEWAEVVNRDTPLAARKLQWEAEAAHEARRVVHQLVPNWFRLYGLPGLAQRRSFIAYRAREDGTWALSPWPEGTTGFDDPPFEGPPLARAEDRRRPRLQGRARPSRQSRWCSRTCRRLSRCPGLDRPGSPRCSACRSCSPRSPG